jgi:DNA-binding IscR family transcriptional regulator
MDIDRLAETLQIPVEEATDAARRLIRLGYLTPIGEEREAVHPARDLSNLTVMEILSITDQFRDDSRSTKREDCPYEGTLEKVFNDVIHAQKNALEGLTFADLMRRCEKQEERKTETTRSHCG